MPADVTGDDVGAPEMARVHEQNPGRWCDLCQKRGWHHTDRHDEFVNPKDDPR